MRHLLVYCVLTLCQEISGLHHHPFKCYGGFVRYRLMFSILHTHGRRRTLCSKNFFVGYTRFIQVTLTLSPKQHISPTKLQAVYPFHLCHVHSSTPGPWGAASWSPRLTVQASGWQTQELCFYIQHPQKRTTLGLTFIA